MQYIPWRVAILILLTGASLEAQFQDRLYPFVELTDEMRDRIDLKDGSVDDWLEVLGEPSLTPLDLALYPNWGYQYDPSSFDFRIWLAWHHGSNHHFVAAEMVDDLSTRVPTTVSHSGQASLTAIYPCGFMSTGTGAVEAWKSTTHPGSQIEWSRRNGTGRFLVHMKTEPTSTRPGSVVMTRIGFTGRPLPMAAAR